MEDKKLTDRIGFIGRSMFDASRLSGSLRWDGGLKFRISNIENDGDSCIADVQRKNGKKYVAKNGAEYDEYEDVGALRFSRSSGSGELVLDIDELGPVKYPFRTYLDVDKDGNEIRKLKFKDFATTKKVNAFRTMFDQAATMVSEQVNDEVPF